MLDFRSRLKIKMKENIRIEIRKYGPEEELAGDDIIEVSLQQDKVSPQFFTLENMVFGQYIRFVTDTKQPVCFAVEVFGKGGKLEKMLKNAC